MVVVAPFSSSTAVWMFCCFFLKEGNFKLELSNSVLSAIKAVSSYFEYQRDTEDLAEFESPQNDLLKIGFGCLLIPKIRSCSSIGHAGENPNLPKISSTVNLGHLVLQKKEGEEPRFRGSHYIYAAVKSYWLKYPLEEK
jgi:hypothetical protein